MCNCNNTNQITDISTLWLIDNLYNFMHIISMQSNEAAVTLSGFGSGRIHRQISGHIRLGRISKI